MNCYKTFLLPKYLYFLPQIIGMDPDLMDDQQRERYNALIRTITNANTEALTSAQNNLQFQSIGKMIGPVHADKFSLVPDRLLPPSNNFAIIICLQTNLNKEPLHYILLPQIWLEVVQFPKL